jgi:Zn-dependent protease
MLETVLYFIPFWVILAFSVIVHECAHAIAAYKLGDPTAYLAGRITLNPIKHIDLVWTIVIPLITYFGGGFIFGGAKPVPINPYNFRDANKGMMLSSLAGPLSNFLLAILGFVGFFLSIKVLPLTGFFRALNWNIFMMMVIINILLGLFNLIPIPPLDGSRVLRYFLPWHMKEGFDRIEHFGFIIIIIFIITGGTSFIGKILYLVTALLNYIAS